MRSQEAPVGERERETKKGQKTTESVVEIPSLQAASLHPLGTLEICRAHRHCPTEGAAAGGLVLSSRQSQVDCSSRGINSPLHLACDTCVVKSTRKPLDMYSQVLASDATRVECTDMRCQEIQAKHQPHPIQHRVPTFIERNLRLRYRTCLAKVTQVQSCGAHIGTKSVCLQSVSSLLCASLSSKSSFSLFPSCSSSLKRKTRDGAVC